MILSVYKTGYIGLVKQSPVGIEEPNRVAYVDVHFRVVERPKLRTARAFQDVRPNLSVVSDSYWSNGDHNASARLVGEPKRL